jgi:translation elongation factor EF-Ts
MEATEFSNSGNNVTDAKKLLIANTEENIEFSRIHTVEVPEASRIGYYIHRTVASSVGSSGNFVVVDLDSEIDTNLPLLNQVIDNLAVHCFSSNPKYLYETGLPEEEYAEIDALVRERMAKAIEGKPEALQQKIMRGAFLKQLESREIMEHQKLGFIDSDETIGEYLEKIQKKIGGGVTVDRYQLFQ